MSALADPQSLRTETDEDLVAGLGRGDEAALRALHRRYAARVFAVAVRFVDAASAEDVVQEVFVTLWNKHETFDPTRGAFRSWISQIARRRALNKLRGKHGRPEDGDDVLAEVADDALPPDEAHWLARRQAVIRAAVDALPAEQRRALSLAFFDELTHEQIAAVLRTPLGTTKTRIRSALKRLAPALVAILAVTIVVLVARRREESGSRNGQALKMVTASDVVPLRLAPAPGAPANAHGSYRARSGASVAVLTTSHLPTLATSESYLAWAHGANGWRLLGPVVIEDDGRSLLVSLVDATATMPDAMRVTRESGSPGDVPGGAIVLAWPAAEAAPP